MPQLSSEKGEEQNPDLIDALRRKSCAESREEKDMEEYLVYFQIEQVRPLVGSGDQPAA